MWEDTLSLCKYTHPKISMLTLQFLYFCISWPPVILFFLIHSFVYSYHHVLLKFYSVGHNLVLSFWDPECPRFSQWDFVQTGSCVSLLCLHHCLRTYLVSAAFRCSRLIMFLSQSCNQPFFQGALVPLRERRYLETNIWALCARCYRYIDYSRPFSRQN